jgi:hypothetical protein
MDEFWLDCMKKVNSRIKVDSDKEKEDFVKAWNAVGSIKYPHNFIEEITPLKYPEPSEEYIQNLEFMEKIKKDLESVCFYGDRPDMIIEDDPHYNEGLFKALAETPERLTVVAMGAGSGSWPLNSNDWAKVYQKAFPEPSMSQETPTQIDSKDMSVRAETEEDRERLWQSIMDVARGG